MPGIKAKLTGTKAKFVRFLDSLIVPHHRKAELNDIRNHIADPKNKINIPSGEAFDEIEKQKISIFISRLFCTIRELMCLPNKAKVEKFSSDIGLDIKPQKKPSQKNL